MGRTMGRIDDRQQVEHSGDRGVERADLRKPRMHPGRALLSRFNRQSGADQRDGAGQKLRNKPRLVGNFRD